MVIAMRWPGAALLVSTFSVPGSFGHCAGCSGGRRRARDYGFVRSAEGRWLPGDGCPRWGSGRLHSHILRHSCGCKRSRMVRGRSNNLGHRSIDSPVR
jgi:integrase